MQMTSDGQIHCLEVIIALIKKVLGDSPALNAMKVRPTISANIELNFIRLRWFKHSK
jgi:hypothetical protein